MSSILIGKTSASASRVSTKRNSVIRARSAPVAALHSHQLGSSFPCWRRLPPISSLLCRSQTCPCPRIPSAKPLPEPRPPSTVKTTLGDGALAEHRLHARPRSQPVKLKDPKDDTKIIGRTFTALTTPSSIRKKSLHTALTFKLPAVVCRLDKFPVYGGKVRWRTSMRVRLCPLGRHVLKVEGTRICSACIGA